MNKINAPKIEKSIGTPEKNMYCLRKFLDFKAPMLHTFQKAKVQIYWGILPKKRLLEQEHRKYTIMNAYNYKKEWHCSNIYRQNRSLQWPTQYVAFLYWS